MFVKIASPAGTRYEAAAAGVSVITSMRLPFKQRRAREYETRSSVPAAV
jgi:hypothetical protein